MAITKWSISDFQKNKAPRVGLIAEAPRAYLLPPVSGFDLFFAANGVQPVHALTSPS